MVPKNCYVKQQELGPFPLGIRIDYVLYKVRPLPVAPSVSLHLSPACADPLSSWSSLTSLAAGEWIARNWFSGNILPNRSFSLALFLGSIWAVHLL